MSILWFLSEPSLLDCSAKLSLCIRSLVCFGSVFAVMPYIAYAYIMPAAVLLKPQQLGHLPRKGVVWLMSTAAQNFLEYEVWYNESGIMAMVLPAPHMVYVGVTKEVFPGMPSIMALIGYAGSALEVWAGTNVAYNGIDVYHRFLVRDIESPNVFSHLVVLGAGTEPKDWFFGKETYCRGQYVTDGVTLIQSARL